MTTIDYALLAAATAIILLAAASWWRRCPLPTRIFSQECVWFIGTLSVVQYVWYEITVERPFQIGMLGAVAVLAVWLAVLLPIATRRFQRRVGAALQTRADTTMCPEPGTDPASGTPESRKRRSCCNAKHRPPQDGRRARVRRRGIAGRGG